jgi:hypothetical protein
VAVTVPLVVIAALGVEESTIPSPVKIMLVTVPLPEAEWQAPSAPRYWLPEQELNRPMISAAFAGAILVAVVNFEILPGAGDPEDVTVPEPEPLWQLPSAPRYWVPLQPAHRETTSENAAFVIDVAPENLAILPIAGVPVIVTVPEPDAVWHAPSAPRY